MLSLPTITNLIIHMKNRITSIFLVLFVFVFTACKNDLKKEQVQDDTATDSIYSNIDDVLEEDYEAGDEEIKEFGIIETIEDGGYPFFVVTVNFVERNIKHDFNLNIEAIDMDMEELATLTDQWATIYYTANIENFLYDLQYKGESVFGEYAPEKTDPSWKKITGILSGAAEVTAGDLPDTVTVTDTNGNAMEFGLFIDAETVKANGKEVTAFYEVRGVNTITHIQPSQED